MKVLLITGFTLFSLVSNASPIFNWNKSKLTEKSKNYIERVFDLNCPYQSREYREIKFLKEEIEIVRIDQGYKELHAKVTMSASYKNPVINKSDNLEVSLVEELEDRSGNLQIHLNFFGVFDGWDDDPLCR